MSDEDEPYDIHDVRVITASSRAIRVMGGPFKRPKWIPKDNIHEDSEVYAYGHSGTLIVKGWYAEAEGYFE